jgi:L-iditol 2-dehydrogenase
MRAGMLDAPQTMVIRELPDPVPEPGGVVLRVGACAVCGTDVRIFNHGHHRIELPAVIGHEIAGTVAALGTGVSGYSVGDTVVLSPPGWSCESCRMCLRGQGNLCEHRQALSYEYPGGFADYVAVPPPLVANGSLHRLDEGIDLAHVAIAEPLACCINGQEQVRWRPDDRVLIIGGGPIGNMHAALVRSRGAEALAIADVAEPRLDTVRRNLSDVTAIDVNTDAQAKITDWAGGSGPDVTIVCTSSTSAYELAFATAGRCGQVLLFAGLPKGQQIMNVDMNQIHYRQLAWYGSFGSMPHQGKAALDMLLSRAVDPELLVTHRYGLSQIPDAISTAQSLAGLKVIIEPQESV